MGTSQTKKTEGEVETLSDDAKKLIMKTFSEFERFLRSPQDIAQYRRKCDEYWDKIESSLKNVSFCNSAGGLDARVKNVVNDFYADYAKYLPSKQDVKMYERQIKNYWDIIEAGIKSMKEGYTDNGRAE